MKPEDQQIAIAKACGWKIEPMLSFSSEHIRNIYTSPNGICVPESKVPHYLNDLNAMHEAEKVLSVGQQQEYTWELTGTVEDHDPDTNEGDWLTHTATAAQRAEAFLKTLNLWTDD